MARQVLKRKLIKSEVDQLMEKLMETELLQVRRLSYGQKLEKKGYVLPKEFCVDDLKMSSEERCRTILKHLSRMK